MVASLFSFGILGNQLFSGNNESWSSIQAAIGRTIYLLRNPSVFTRDTPENPRAQSATYAPNMRESNAYDDDPNPYMVLYLLSFQFVVVYILSNLYRAVLFAEYASTSLKFSNKPASDLTDDPWPTPLKWCAAPYTPSCHPCVLRCTVEHVHVYALAARQAALGLLRPRATGAREAHAKKSQQAFG
jgi:hypothetical protein